MRDSTRRSVPRPCRGAWILALLLVAGPGGCTSPARRADDSTPRPQGAVLFLLDTVRADHLSGYGNARPTSPTLDALARDGAVFETVVAAAPWTLPSVRTILAARGVERAVNEQKRLSVSVVDALRRAGFRTGAVTEGGFLSKRLGVAEGFEEYAEEEGVVQLVREDKPRDPNPTGGIRHTFERAKRWIAAHRDERFFLMVHTYEAHAPYRHKTFTAGMPPAGFGDVFTIETGLRMKGGEITVGDADVEYLRALYDGGIRTIDDEIGGFLEYLDTLGLRDRTLVVATADHGEEFGEHNRQHSGDHGHSLHDNLLLVPLVVRNPMERYPVQRVDVQVRTFDVMPTIADILGVPLDFQTDGASLVPMLRGQDHEERVAYGGRTKYGPEQVFLRHHGYKYITVTAPQAPDRAPVTPPPPPVQLYDLRADPGELTNVADSQPGKVAEMARLLATLQPEVSPHDPSGPVDKVDPALDERLRSLGYVR